MLAIVEEYGLIFLLTYNPVHIYMRVYGIAYNEVLKSYIH